MLMIGKRSGKPSLIATHPPYIYICPRQSCLERVMRNNSLSLALKISHFDSLDVDFKDEALKAIENMQRQGDC